MILNDLLGGRVTGPGGEELGRVIDVRFVIDGPPGQLLAEARVAGLIVSARSSSSFLGYERTDVRAPLLLARLLRYRNRGAFLVAWEDVLRVGSDGRVLLRPGFTRRSPALPRTRKR